MEATKLLQHSSVEEIALLSRQMQLEINKFNDIMKKYKLATVNDDNPLNQIQYMKTVEIMLKDLEQQTQQHEETRLHLINKLNEL
jgi:hypothetical protein